MILYNGKIFESIKQNELISKLEKDIPQILEYDSFSQEELLDACDIIATRAKEGRYDALAKPLLEFAHISYESYLAYIEMFSKTGLKEKLKHELNGLNLGYHKINDKLAQIVSPLGVLFHISAGNLDFLPAYTVIEGLLVGNINILKLPTGDNGLSIAILKELIDILPSIAKYIYVFDVPSSDFDSITSLAKLANGIVVWGGDAAIKAARKLAMPNQKIIEWGHKLSFAYVLKDYKKEDLRLLAKDICTTNQLLCSSAQGIYFDSDNNEELIRFSEDFFEILKEENLICGKAPISMIGKNTLNIYNEKLENSNLKIFNENGVSVIIRDDEKLELSYLYRNVWVKALPKEKIISVLANQYQYLQSVAVIGEEERDTVIQKLIKAGVTNISHGDMSSFKQGSSHDGQFPLMQYIKIVNLDIKIQGNLD